MKLWGKISTWTMVEILRWAEEQPWARAMAACQQDAGWHAEGDVWAHTRMVCEALEQVEGWVSLNRDSQLKLIFAAMFHDSGKPATTALDPESGRLRSPKHAVVGAGIVRQVLRELGCGLATREEIVALVRYHGRPPYLLEKLSPEREVISLSWMLNNRLLYLLTLADTRGRDSTGSPRPEENLHLWRMVAEEHGCLDAPYAFVNDQARFLFFREQLSSLHYTPHENFRARVTMMSGLPGAGKDTWLARHRPGMPVVSLDALREELDVEPGQNQGRVIQAAREQCREHLRAGRDFAFNATNLTRLTRGRWIDLFADYSARVEMVYLEPPLEVVLAQNRQRPEPVPETVILRLVDKLEPPSITEGHGLEIHC